MFDANDTKFVYFFSYNLLLLNSPRDCYKMIDACALGALGYEAGRKYIASLYPPFCLSRHLVNARGLKTRGVTFKIQFQKESNVFFRFTLLNSIVFLVSVSQGTC